MHSGLHGPVLHGPGWIVSLADVDRGIAGTAAAAGTAPIRPAPCRDVPTPRGLEKPPWEL